MRLCFYIDPETGLPHIYKHGIREGEAEEILLNKTEDYPSRDGLRSAIGQTSAGRYLRVIYRPGEELVVVTAYELRRNELQAYKRRMRRSGRRRQR